MAKVRKPALEPEVEQGTDFEALLKFIEGLVKDVPEEDWKKLPRDLARHFDDYSTGIRKHP